MFTHKVFNNLRYNSFNGGYHHLQYKRMMAGTKLFTTVQAEDSDENISEELYQISIKKNESCVF